MLTNAEGWINVTKQDLQDLEKPDIILVRSVFESTASKVFMMLEVGFLPVRFVIMKKTFTIPSFNTKREHKQHDKTGLQCSEGR